MEYTQYLLNAHRKNIASQVAQSDDEHLSMETFGLSKDLIDSDIRRCLTLPSKYYTDEKVSVSLILKRKTWQFVGLTTNGGNYAD